MYRSTSYIAVTLDVWIGLEEGWKFAYTNKNMQRVLSMVSVAIQIDIQTYVGVGLFDVTVICLLNVCVETNFIWNEYLCLNVF